MKIEIPKENFYHLINHGPCCLITTGDEKQKNIASVAWITPINDCPPLVGICVASSHYTSQLIKKYKSFTINIPNLRLLELVKKCGSVSGRKEDKFEKFNIVYNSGVKIKAVYLKDCIGFIETNLYSTENFRGVILFVGKVVYCSVEKNLYNNYLIPNKAKTLHHIGGLNFFVSSRIISYQKM